MLMHHIVDEHNILLHFGSAVTDNDILCARTHTHTRTLQRSLLHALQWHVARIRGLWRSAIGR
jgi:hypothetical protein